MARVVDTRKVAEAIGYCTMQDLLELAVHLHEDMGERAFNNFVRIIQDQLNDPGQIPGQTYAIRMTLNPKIKIQMIKLVRVIQGSGLKEAKQFVDDALFTSGLTGKEYNPDEKFVYVLKDPNRQKLVDILDPILRDNSLRTDQIPVAVVKVGINE